MSIFEQVCGLGSFRDCRDEAIPRKIMGRILEAGRNAPSPGNVQSLEFIVVEDEEKRQRLARITDDRRVEEAPASVIILSDRERMKRKTGSEPIEFCTAEGAIAAQNMRLVAGENGISSCWISGFDKEAVREDFRAPQQKIPVGIVMLGYSDDEVEPESRFPLNSVCYYDEYDNQVASFFDNVEWKGLREEKRIYGKKASTALGRIKRRIKKLL